MRVRARTAFVHSEFSNLGKRFLAAQSPSVRRILQLNYDVLHLIFRRLDKKTLKSLTFFFGNWRDVAMGELLRSIEYCADIGPVNPSFVYPDERVEGEPYLSDSFNPLEEQLYARDKVEVLTQIKTATHVRDIALLHHLMDREPDLRPLVRRAYLKREQDNLSQVDEVCKWIDTDYLQHLHITGSPSGRVRVKLSATSACRTKHIDMSDPHIANNAVQVLRGLFQDQSLEAIHIDQFVSDDIREWATAAPPPQLSPIKGLVFTNGVPGPEVLSTILSWVKRLSRLHLDIGCQKALDENYFSISRTIETLICTHASSLEELFIGGIDGSTYLSTMQPADFRPLTSLRSLDVMLRCLVYLNPSFSDEMISGIFENAKPPKYTLPSSLTDLTIRVDPSFTWTRMLWWDADPALASYGTTYFAVQFMAWLARLCNMRPSPVPGKPSLPVFPHLKHVSIIRQLRHGVEIADEGHEARYTPFFHKFWQKYATKFESRGITLEAWRRDRSESAQRWDVGSPDWCPDINDWYNVSDEGDEDEFENESGEEQDGEAATVTTT